MDTTPTPATPAKTTTTADGLKITVVKEGTGAGAAKGDTVTVNYTGKLTDGTVYRIERRSEYWPSVTLEPVTDEVDA